MLILRSNEDVKEYIKSKSNDRAVFTDVDADFVVNKYLLNIEALKNVDYLWDRLLNITSVEFKRVESEYDSDSVLQDDVQLYTGSLILKNSEVIGKAVESRFGVMLLNYGNVMTTFDPRGFRSSTLIRNSDGSVKRFIYSKDNKLKYIQNGENIYDVSLKKNRTIEDVIKDVYN